MTLSMLLAGKKLYSAFHSIQFDIQNKFCLMTNVFSVLASSPFSSNLLGMIGQY